MPQKTTEELREELITLLKTHDWTYGYSDDYGHWSRENAKRRQIDALVKLVPDGTDLYFAHRSKDATY